MRHPLLSFALIVVATAVALFPDSLPAQAPPVGHTGHAQHGQHVQQARKDSTSKQDSAFAALQRRGATAMGVDQYASSHVFEALADGGSITYVATENDTVAAAQIRAHLRDIAVLFAAGDFSTPKMVHAQDVPGTAIMKARRNRIRYAVADVPRGAVLRMTTTDRAALGAIRAFISFQRSDHRSPRQTPH